MPENVIVKFGPCCFCGKDIEETDVDPLWLRAETASSKWQVWHCHAACFKRVLVELPEMPGFFDPAHF